MPRGINLVVTCSKRKTRVAPDALRLRHVLPSSPPEERARAWRDRLDSPHGETIPAAKLYCGDHWSVAKSLAEWPHIRVWVCSAGYGLIPFESDLQPYEATFSAGQPDSVAARGDESATVAHARWWETLASWQGPAYGAPRTIAQLARAFPGDFLLASVSEVYLTALAVDLRLAALGPDAAPDSLAILSAGARELGDLSPFLLPCDARLQPVVSGALASLNVRLARLLVEHVPTDEWSLEGLRSRLAEWGATQPVRARYDRTSMSDEEVRQAIEAALEEEPTLRPTPLLRRLRDSGRACEHSRFVRLFHETAGGVNGRNG